MGNGVLCGSVASGRVRGAPVRSRGDSGAWCWSDCSGCAFAEEPAAGTAQDLSSIVNTAGTTLKDQFIILVNTLVPVLIGIAVVGLGLYAVIYLFKMAKKFFAQASK